MVFGESSRVTVRAFNRMNPNSDVEQLFRLFVAGGLVAVFAGGDAGQAHGSAPRKAGRVWANSSLTVR